MSRDIESDIAQLQDRRKELVKEIQALDSEENDEPWGVLHHCRRSMDVRICLDRADDSDEEEWQCKLPIHIGGIHLHR
jgi:hypothetical protein